MNYIEMCQHIFEGEGFNWEEYHKSRSRIGPLKTTRHICMYIGSLFFTDLSLRQLASPFGLDHATVIHAKKTINNDCETDKEFSFKVNRYIIEVRNKITEGHVSIVSELTHQENYMRRLMKTIDEMELVARVYCDITGKKMVKA